MDVGFSKQLSVLTTDHGDTFGMGALIINSLLGSRPSHMQGSEEVEE